MFGFWEGLIFLNIVLSLFIVPNLGNVFVYFQNQKIEVVSSYIALWGIVVLIKYTWETQKIREDTKTREVRELRGYFGIETESTNRINIDSWKFTFKNFGATPLYNFKMETKLRNRTTDEAQTISISGGQIINPKQVLPFSNKLELKEGADRKNFDLIFEATFSIYTQDKFSHISRVTLVDEFDRYKISEEKETMIYSPGR